MKNIRMNAETGLISALLGTAGKVPAPETWLQKKDAGKPPVYQGVLNYFPLALIAIANVSLMGRNKYGEWGGWLKVPDGLNRYTDAKVRHSLYEAAGEQYDEESGLLHAAHEAWNALARLELILRDIKNSNKAVEIGR